MSAAIKCDLCKRFEEGDAKATVVVAWRFSYSLKACSECAEKIVEFTKTLMETPWPTDDGVRPAEREDRRP